VRGTTLSATLKHIGNSKYHLQKEALHVAGECVSSNDFPTHYYPDAFK